jgi:hypothetical protein
MSTIYFLLLVIVILLGLLVVITRAILSKIDDINKEIAKDFMIVPDDED